MRLLLDTHTLLWWWDDDAKLSEAARAALTETTNEVHVSAATAWEIATKKRLGKLSIGPMPAGGFAGLVAADGFLHLPVTAAHAWRAGSLDSAHRDPFDRMLAAQAQLDRLMLVSRDPVFAELQARTLW
jgi:PIN domain nuclease of toxin-antitoxin system